MKIGKYDLARTCSSCPEQYDVYDGTKLVGYLRLRHGHFTASVPGAGGEVVYEAFPQGDGMFETHERDGYLRDAIDAIDARISPPATRTKR